MNEQQIVKLWEQAAAAERREDWPAANRLYHTVANAFPMHAPTFQRLGLLALRLGRPNDAVDYFHRSLSIEPTDAVCLNNLGNVLREVGRQQEALSAYTQAIDLQPSYPSALSNLADILAHLGNHTKAVETYRDLLHLDSDDAEAWKALGLSLLQLDEETESKKALGEALRLKPGDAETLSALGVAHQYEGDLETAESLYLASIESDPGFVRGYENLVRSRKMSVEDFALVGPIEKIAVDESRDDESRLIAHFALGKLYDDCAEYGKAFENFTIGNSLMNRSVDFDASKHSEWIDRIISEYSEEFFRSHSGEGNPSTRPVFVVGMNRSGTSLVEQILASHSQVYGAGELAAITRLAINLPNSLNSSAEYPTCLPQLDANAIRETANVYLHFLSDHDSQALRVVDKLPENFLHLGFIATLFPNAHIVHCQRAPLDVCLSIYFNRFAEANHYAYDIDNIAAYYADYERLIAHWRKVLPVEILDVQYELLLDNLERESRRMLDYCELDWENACLAFHRSRRPVRTASSWQVRQPIYRTSMERWRNFDPYLDGFKKALWDRGVIRDSVG